MDKHAEFGARLQYLIKLAELGGTQRDIAKKLGVSGATINKWLNGRALPPLDKALDLAEALGCSFEYLITGRGDPKIEGSSKSLPVDAIPFEVQRQLRQQILHEVLVSLDAVLEEVMRQKVRLNKAEGSGGGRSYALKENDRHPRKRSEIKE